MILVTPLKGCFLANQLRLLAHVIAFGMETGHQVYYPEFHANCHHFPNGPRGLLCGWSPTYGTGVEAMASPPGGFRRRGPPRPSTRRAA